MNQLLPLGNGDCAFNSPRQICDALSLPPMHFNEDLAPTGGSWHPHTGHLLPGARHKPFWLLHSP